MDLTLKLAFWGLMLFATVCVMGVFWLRFRPQPKRHRLNKHLTIPTITMEALKVLEQNLKLPEPKEYSAEFRPGPVNIRKPARYDTTLRDYLTQNKGEPRFIGTVSELNRVFRLCQSAEEVFNLDLNPELRSFDLKFTGGVLTIVFTADKIEAGVDELDIKAYQALLYGSTSTPEWGADLNPPYIEVPPDWKGHRYSKEFVSSWRRETEVELRKKRARATATVEDAYRGKTDGKV